MKVRDKVVVVTGGASGIGKSLCERFAAEGALAVVVADINQDGVDQVAALIADKTRVLAIRTDVSHEADVKALVAITTETFGRIDLFCSNAGIFTMGGEEVDNDAWIAFGIST
jgi:NAD(P)-dependent dehydrogenase (short-subunit alcohol dehydrogenase family)